MNVYYVLTFSSVEIYHSNLPNFEEFGVATVCRGHVQRFVQVSQKPVGLLLVNI